MLNLILWRHAHANDGTDDLARELSEKGTAQAEKMGAFLRKRLPENTEVFVSQAKRSQQTAAFFSENSIILPTINPDVHAPDLVRVLHSFADKKNVLVVGHQPWIGQICAYLLNGDWGDKPRFWSVKKGAFWWFQVQFDGDDVRVKLKMCFSPNDLD